MTIKNPRARERITQALTSLLLDDAFFGTLAMKLKFVEREDIQTEATDGVNLFYNPTFIESLTFTQVKSEICHEVRHCAKFHQFRRDNRDPKIWNCACDYVINNEMVDEGHKLDVTWLVDFQYKGMSEEQVYTKLSQQSKQEQDKQYEKGCLHGGIQDAQGTADAGVEEQKQDWTQAVIQAAQQAKAQGMCPAFAEVLVKDLTTTKVDWRAATRKFIEQTALNDFTWTRPARNYVTYGLYLPSLKSDKLPPVVFGFDTSGSRWSDEDRKIAATELTSLIQDAHPEKVYVLYFDTQVKNPQVFENGDPITLKPSGGGGTDFTCVFDYVSANEIEPCCAIFVTDLQGSFPDDAPSYPVLWVSDGDQRAPFGDVIDIRVR